MNFFHAPLEMAAYSPLPLQFESGGGRAARFPLGALRHDEEVHPTVRGVWEHPAAHSHCLQAAGTRPVPGTDYRVALGDVGTPPNIRGDKPLILPLSAHEAVAFMDRQGSVALRTGTGVRKNAVQIQLSNQDILLTAPSGLPSTKA